MKLNEFIILEPTMLSVYQFIRQKIRSFLQLLAELMSLCLTCSIHICGVFGPVKN